MISKVFGGHSFYHACRYVCNKTGAEVLEAEGVRGYNYRYMADDFLEQAADRPTKGQACFHAVLSFYPGEKPTDKLMVEIAKKYLEEIGITDTQFAIAKHTDKAHLHLHIIANMVNNEGVSISDSWIGARGKRAAQKLTKEYGLVPAEKKNLALTNLDALGQSERNRYQIYTAIVQCLPFCRNLDGLAAALKKQGIETVFKYKGQTTQRQGISFKIGKDCFKGSKVDRKFSLGNLEKVFARQRLGIEGVKLSRFEPEFKHNFVQAAPSTSAVVSKMETFLEVLLQPEVGQNFVPYHLRNTKKKKKRKGMRL